MARKDKRTTVYPSERAMEIIGIGASKLNQALECWAETIAQASADNAKTFRKEEWLYLADLLNGTMAEPQIGSAGQMLAFEVTDGHELDGLGGKWFGDNADQEVQDLVTKLNTTDYAHAWALIMAIQFFWDNCQQIKLTEDQWWTIPFRREFATSGKVENQPEEESE